MEPIVSGPSKAEKGTQRVILKLTQVSPAHPDGRLTDRTRCVQLDASQPSVLLGRASKNRSLVAAKDNLWIESPIITKEHARFLMGENAEQPVILRDLNSTHGTWIGNQSIRQDYPIYDGDIVRFGTEIQTGPQVHKPHTFIIEAQWQNMSRPVTPAVPAPQAEISRFSVPDMTDDEDSMASEYDLTRTDTVNHQRIDSTGSTHSRQSSVSRSYEVPYSDDDDDDDEEDEDDDDDEEEEVEDEGEEEVYECRDGEQEGEETSSTANGGNAVLPEMTNYIELDGDEGEQGSEARPPAVTSNVSVAVPPQQEVHRDETIITFMDTPATSAPLQSFCTLLPPASISTIPEAPAMSNETNQFASDKYDEDQDVQEISKSAFIASKHVANGVKSYWEGTDAHDNGTSVLANDRRNLKELFKSHIAWQKEKAQAAAEAANPHAWDFQASSMRTIPKPPNSPEQYRPTFPFGSVHPAAPKPTDAGSYLGNSPVFDPRSTDAVMVKRLGRAENPVWPQVAPVPAPSSNFAYGFNNDDVLTFECFPTKPAAAALPSISSCTVGYKDGPFAQRGHIPPEPAPPQARLSTRLSIDNIINKDQGELKRKANDAGLDDPPAAVTTSQASNASYEAHTSNQSFDGASTRAQPGLSETHSAAIDSQNSEIPAGGLESSSPEAEEPEPHYLPVPQVNHTTEWTTYSPHQTQPNANNTLNYFEEEVHEVGSDEDEEDEEDDIDDLLFSSSKATGDVQPRSLGGGETHDGSMPSLAATQEEIIQEVSLPDEPQEQQDETGQLVEAAVEEIAMTLKEPMAPAELLDTAAVEDNTVPAEESDSSAHAVTQEEDTAQQPPLKKRKIGDHVVSHRHQRGGRRGVRRFMGKLIPFMAGAAATATAIFGAAGVLISTMPDEIQRQARLEMGG